MIKHARFIVVSLLAITVSQTVISQSLSVNTTGAAANASSILDVSSNAKGVLIPRMTKAEKNAIASPASGLLIYQTAPDSVGFHYYESGSWIWLSGSVSQNTQVWRLTGNTATIDGTNFIGTTDNIPFNIRVNNQKAGRIENINANSFFGYQAGNLNSSGVNNTAMGLAALSANLSGTNNTAIGALASRDNTTGGQNTSVGYGALILNTVGTGNTAQGFYALYNNVAGSNATAVGNQSMLYANNTSTPFTNNNVAVGYESLKGSSTPANNTGVSNTALGYQTIFNNTTGNNNTATGLGALFGNSTGNNNTAFGTQSLTTNTTGNSNVAIGGRALFTNSVSSNLVAVGDSSLYFNTGTGNTAIGSKSLYSNSSGTSNTAVGANAMLNNLVGFSNVTVGAQSLRSNTSASRNVAVGDSAMFTQSFNNGGASYFIDNTAIGSKALFYNQPTTNTNGAKNTGIGSEALYLNTTGQENTAIGTGALHDNITGSQNTAVGRSAHRLSKSGTFNSYMGYESGYPDSLGVGNTGIGALVLRNNGSGSNNVAMGYQALFNNTASGSTAIGYQALTTNISGTNNTALGNLTNVLTTNLTNATAIGYRTLVAQSNSLILGSINGVNGASADTKVGIGTTTPLSLTHISGGNFLVTGTFGSSSAIEVSGAGTRMFFYPRKAALRAGNVSGTQWDDANIGDYSIAMGQNAQAKTIHSVSIGEGNISETSPFAVAIGRENHSTGFASLAMGHFSEAVGDYSASIGLRDTIYVGGYAATALGGYNKVSSAYGFAAGFTNTVAGVSGAALGNNNEAPSYGETTIGNFATQYTALNAGNVNAADRVFTIGNGTGTGSRSNAMVVLKSGNTGLGTSTPNSTLHVDGTIAVGTSLNIAGGTVGSPVLLLNQKSYVGVLPANATSNYYQLPDPTLYPGRTYIIRNNSSVDPANITTAAGLLFPGNSNIGGATYTLNPTSSPKTVMAISDGANWIIMAQN